MARIDPNKKQERIHAFLPDLLRLVSPCRACGRACGADRIGNGTGVCRAGNCGGASARWQAAVPHFGEEPMLVGQGGSGTVFFSHCTIRCDFCQNWQISHAGEGQDGTHQQLAREFLSLQERGVENINLVTPTQYILPIVRALGDAYEQGLEIPLVYNTNGYDSVELVRLLNGVVDVWLPDFKFMAPDCGRRYSSADNYPDTAKAALREMYALAGPLSMEGNVATGGVILRHLVLPDDRAGSFDLLLWLQDEGMTDITLSLMSQYSPQYHASRHPEIDRPITPKEYHDVVDFAVKLGFENILVQEMESREAYLPDFTRDRPFD